MPVGPIKMSPMTRLHMEVGATLERIGMREARVNTNPPASGYNLREVRGVVEVFYIDTQRRAEVQKSLVERAEPLLVERFGRGRVSRKNRGDFKGFRITLA